MIKIRFRRKDMGELEAKLYLTGLKTGIIKPNLTEEEKVDYLRWEGVIKDTNERCRARRQEEYSEATVSSERGAK